jgi:hypothetical protein
MSVVVGSNSPISDNPVGVPLIGYDNVVTPAGLLATTESVGFPITNVANPATHLYWKGGINTGNEIITINTGSALPIDYIGIAGHNWGSAHIPVVIEDSGHSPPVTLVSSTLLPDDTPTIFRFPQAVYSQFSMTLDLSAVPDDGLPQLAVLYCGRLLVLERGIKIDVTHVPIPFGRRTRVVNGMSESGNFLGRIVLSESRQSVAEFFGFTPAFYRASIDPFLNAAQEAPFFWAWAPAEYPLETGFAWLINDAEPQVSPDHRRVALTLEMAGIA